MQLNGPWTRDETSAVGQVFEFRLWALLTEQSRGGLHVFLPLADRGVDALVHRITDGMYFQVQAKSRSTLQDGEVHLVVLPETLVHDEVLIVAGLVVEGGVGPTLLVAPAADFRRLADLTSDEGKPVYSAEFGMRPRSDTRWLPWLVALERLGERFGAPLDRVEEALPEVRPEWRSDLGTLGESEVIRRLCEAAGLNLFRPFPDLETAELAVMHIDSRRVVGLQIKTVEVDESRFRATVNVRASSFRPAPATHFVVLAWVPDQSRFHEDFLFIPSVELVDVARDDSYGHLSFDWHLSSETPSALDKYRHALKDLKVLVTREVSA